MENYTLLLHFSLKPSSSFFFFFFFFPNLIIFPIKSTSTSPAKPNFKESIQIGLQFYNNKHSNQQQQQQQRSPSPTCPCFYPPKHPPPPPPPPPPASLNPTDFKDPRLYPSYVAIQRFKTTITCDPRNATSTWSGPSICETYSGVFCDNPPDNKSAVAVASIDFNEFGICAPTLQGFINNLPDIAIFHANSNNFSGAIPDVSKLPYLYELDLSNNKFVGSFPVEVVGLTQLLFLDIRYNFFSGTVPPAVFDETLAVLFLNNNLFNQPIPANLGSTTAQYITLANNGFTGSLPRSIGNASSTLVEIVILSNHISGCLPYEVGLLNKATVFDVSNNFITGPIPYSLGCMTSIEQLVLANNLFYGDVPELVCQVGSLLNFSLANNYFTGIGPSCTALLKKGVLDLRQNCVPGIPDQRSHEECIAFRRTSVECPLPATYHYVPCKPSHPPCSPNCDGGGGSVSQFGRYGGGNGRRPSYSVVYGRNKP